MPSGQAARGFFGIHPYSVVLFAPMRDLTKLIASLAKLTWYSAVAVVAGVAWCVFTAARVLSGGSRSAQRSTGKPPLSPASTSEPESVRRKRLPKPPSMDEYRSAGVDADSCGFCQKRTTERAREWRYMVLDGRPAVVCPTCWRKHVTNNSDAGAAAFEARIGSKVWNSPRIEDTYRGLRGE